MEGYGGEIGHKMRSAVKAKLVELGTGKAGYIDDELPDYVMIMVANKRSKQQMCNDLNLFLGEQTELFVTWLHEVLHKLEEVTLPVANTSSKKQKRKGSKERDVGGKKERKSSKKDRKSSPDTEVPTTTTTDVSLPSVNSINDVFAEELLEKAKKSMDVDLIAKNEIKKKKNRKPSNAALSDITSPNNNAAVNTDEFDIPTISEISSTTENQKQAALSAREKDLAELASIQKQIDLAKKQLKAKGELPNELLDYEDNIEDKPPSEKKRDSIDHDFLNLKDDNMHDFSEASNEAPEATHKSDRSKAKSPIVFDLHVEKSQPNKTTKSHHDNGEIVHKLNNSEDQDTEEQRKRSIHERLGSKNARPSRSRREQELYIPAFRRKEMDSSVSRDRNRSRSPNRSAKTSPVRQSRDRTRNSSGARRNYSPERRSARTPRRQSRSPNPERRKSVSPSEVVRKRIGSRVIVAPVKKIESSDEDIHDKPVNSVIKIKPRSKISPSKQACKNLLLKAVADAQRSTILPKKPKEKRPATERLGRRTDDNSQPPLYTKTFKNRLEKDSSSGLISQNKKNFIIEVEADKDYENRNHANGSDDYQMAESPYYESNPEDIAYESDSLKGSTQFVVTLDEDKARSKLGKRVLASRSHTVSPSPLVSSSTSASYRKATSSHNRNQRSNIHSRLSHKHFKDEDDSSCSSRRKSDLIEFYRKPKEIEKLIIKPDTDEDDEQVHKPSFSNNSSNSTISKTSNEREKSKSLSKSKEKEIEEERSTTPPLPPSLAYLAISKVDKKSKESGLQESPISPRKRKHELIKYDAEARKESKENIKENLVLPTKKTRSSNSSEKTRNGLALDENRASSLERHAERRKINTRKIEDRKYDHIPSLNSVPVDTSALKPFKTKERCIYHPNCTKNICEFYHPSAPCKAFPNCKFGDKCLYTHPKCKFDQSCVNAECNYMHTLPRNLPTAPPLSSHVVPVQSYKSISASTAPSTSAVMCKYYPNCTKSGCSFYHPKLCRYGKNCINKLECAFYHPEAQSCNKFKWVAQTG